MIVNFRNQFSVWYKSFIYIHLTYHIYTVTKPLNIMIKKNSTNLNLFLAVIFLLLQTNAKAQLLKVNGKKIVNSSTNQEVILNAVNFGNWMVMEGYMMNSSDQAPDQHTWKNKLTNLIGSSNTTIFYNAWLTNHVAQADINQIKSWGFNSVRLPIHYEYFVNAGSPDVWDDQGFNLLDNIISWCTAAGVYVIIDLHAAPGGQSNGAISDYDSTKPSLWESEANKLKTINLWRRLSERYKHEVWVAGYDLLNEPAWNLPNGTDLRNLYGRITDAIRSTGDSHILFIEGNWYANDFTGLTPAWDTNMVYSFHKYWSNATTEDIKWITDFRDAQNRPIWCGEHGENSNDHFTKIVETFTANGTGFGWWPMKKFESINDFADAKFPVGYTELLNYMGGTNPGLDPAKAFNTLMQLAENVKLANCTIQTEVLRSVFTQSGNRKTEPFSNNQIPGKLFTPNYDKGMNGYAYSDQSWEDVRLTTGIYTAWNNGWVYRNNGVDLERTFDPGSNGYTVGWFNKGEWLKYTVDVAEAGTYKLQFRVANGFSKNGIVQIQNGDGTELLATATVPPTGGWGTWTSISVNGVFRTSGLQEIRMVNTIGEFNVNSINFVFENSSLPAKVTIPPSQKVISLKGNNSKYVTFSGPANLISCTGSTQGTIEEFTIVDAGNGLVALKGSNNKFVSVGSDNLLYCSASAIGTKEKFTMEDLSGALSFKGFNNLYVSSENGATTGMPCTRKTAQAWEYFNWTYIRDNVIISVATDELAANGYKVFPNPARNTINISSTLNRHPSIIIYDLGGKEVIHTTLIGSDKSIDLNSIPNGVYLMRIIESEQSVSVKFIKAN
jgi:aryl-phospho-beta-D-glucosidase BglC (GH1 family)